MPLTYASAAAFVAALAKAVPDMKGGYTEADFITEACDALSEDLPGFATVDVGDGSTVEYVLGTTPFAGFVLGFSDSWPIEFEQLDASGLAYRPPAAYLSSAPYLARRTTSTVPTTYLTFPTAPGSTSKCRVRFRIPWVIGASITVPPQYHSAIVKKAAARKCAALSTFYKQTIDPAGGSDIFDARQYAESYAADAERWEAEYEKSVPDVAKSSGVTFGRVQGSGRIPVVFPPWGR